MRGSSETTLIAQVIRCAAPVICFFALCMQSAPAQPAPAAPAAASPAPAKDPLGRTDPQATVMGFLQACRAQDYRKAAEYLDLRAIPLRRRSEEGPSLARRLEAILNSASSQFSVLRLSRNPDGNPAEDPAGNRAHVLTVEQEGRSNSIGLERVVLQTGAPQVWLFSQSTVAVIPDIRVSNTPPLIERYLPPFLVRTQFIETALWKWIALVALALLMISVSRLLDRLIAALVKLAVRIFRWHHKFGWVDALIEPFRVIAILAVFRAGVAFIDPSAIARLYIGRAMQVLFVGSIAWCLVRLTGSFVDHVELKLDAAQHYSSRTMLRLGRRTAAATIVILAILLVLQNWGYNTSTLIAGLGVGGIAVALAAQQTIANVFGGVSIIGDHPVGIGDFGKFGDIVGSVEDIGMRSTRVRTLSRTLVSVPNSNFAGLNLENFSVRDKILFNPTLQIKRSTTDDQIHELIAALDKMFGGRKDLEPVATPARVIGLTSASYSLEIFCYVLTADINQFYRVQGDLLLEINDLLTNSHVELA